MEEDKLTAVMLQLADLGVKAINVYYEGSGDSGAIESVIYTTEEKKAQDWIDYPDNVNHWGDNCKSLSSLSSSHDETIRNLCYNKILDNIGDWYNNEGGYGYLTIEVPSCKFHCLNSLRIIHIEVEDHEGNLMKKL